MTNHNDDVLDSAALDRLYDVTGGDPEFMRELVLTFVDDAPRQLDEMQTACGDKNAAEVRRLAHGLKSNGADFGATDFSELCQRLEHQAANDNLEEADSLIAALKTEFERVKNALEDYINS